MKNNRLLLYVHFNRANNLSEYVVYQLTKIKPLFAKTVFITNSKLSEKDKKRLTGLYDDFIQRENIGFDFGAWRDGFKYVGWNNLEKYTSVTLMNDTCFGPIYPMSDVYATMDDRKVDYWGLTDHDYSNDGMPGTNQSIPYHLQSYMLVFNKSAIKSKELREFWGGVKDHTSVNNVIQEYETQLTRILNDKGLKSGVYFDTIDYSKLHDIKSVKNYSEFMPTILLDSKVPLIKIKSFIHTPILEIKNRLKISDYNTDLIYSGLNERSIAFKEKPTTQLGIFLEPYVKNVISNRIILRVAKKYPKISNLSSRVLNRFFDVNTLKAQNTVPADHNTDKLISNSYNPNLSINYAEHLNLLQDNKTYRYEKESEHSYARHNDDPRLVAIYLPQFHPFKENNEAWGKGFTEWTNVTTSHARFVGQQQPALPSDLGYYDLRLPTIIKQQIDLAKKYGIYGFQFYYYWFSGKKVMDTPINTVLANKDWDFNFSICWANENWTKKWDGGDKDIIFEQKDTPDDPIKFIKDVAPILSDERYITENGKPILTVYRVDLLKDPKRYVKVWREYFKKEFSKELWLVGCTNFKNFKPSTYGFDALMDFTPTGSTSSELKPWVGDNKIINSQFTNKLIDINWNGLIVDYRYIAKKEIANLHNNINDYKTISPSWCNESRRKGNDGVTFYNSSPEIFANWLDSILHHEIKVKHKKSPLVFINAWNEWAEEAMIEPSMHLGHNTLRRIAEVVSGYSLENANKDRFPKFNIKRSKKTTLAVIIHLYYVDMWPQIKEKLKNINQSFDIFITVPIHQSKFNIAKISNYHKNTNIVTAANRGRDVLPFITLMNHISGSGYKYVLKLHSKKSKHRDDGEDWFADIIDNLLPPNQDAIKDTLNRDNCGIIGPSGHVVSLSRHMGSNEPHLHSLIRLITDSEGYKYFRHKSKYPFIGSTMFWAKTDLFMPLTDLYLMPSDFESEQGQIDGTMAHAVERLLGGVLHDVVNRSMYMVDAAGTIKKIEKVNHSQEYKYAK